MPGTSLPMDPDELHSLGVLPSTATSFIREANPILTQNWSPRRERDEMAPSFSPSKHVSSDSKTREAATGWGIRQLHQTLNATSCISTRERAQGRKARRKKRQ